MQPLWRVLADPGPVRLSSDEERTYVSRILARDVES